jgi:hypothetical protein
VPCNVNKLTVKMCTFLVANIKHTMLCCSLSWHGAEWGHGWRRWPPDSLEQLMQWKIDMRFGTWY